MLFTNYTYMNSVHYLLKHTDKCQQNNKNGGSVCTQIFTVSD